MQLGNRNSIRGNGVERSQPVCPPFKLQLEECLSAEQVPTPELIQGYVKKVGLLYKCQAEGFVSLCPAGRKGAGGKEEGGDRGGE
ncbi:raftlin-like isoform X2 [Lates japonicus]|uniref:Raftlin-like isoform X2 n=1 Tax=Lates japonicus TaxID=270547 RepID=A0AAD3MFW0_LATJO|nr:raftlin-like isoform X2 [Lates japonicus]